MTEKLFFILTFLFFICPSCFAADCSDIEINPNIKITSSYGKLTYDKTKNFEQVTELAKKYNLVEQGLFASGLSTVNVTFDITINTIARPIKDNDYCVIPTDINIFIGLDHPTIYLSNELNENSCTYNLVLRHEKTHQQINKKTLEYFLPLFKEASLKIVKNIKPISINDKNLIEQSTADLTRLYNKKLMPLIDYIKTEMLNEQRKLDTNENYKFESSVCSSN